jgi:hypothetical protein
LIDGELPGEQLQSVEEHIAGCMSCRVFRSSIMEMTAYHRSLADVPPPPSLADGVQAGISGKGERGLLGLLFGHIAMPVFTSLILILGVLVGGMLSGFLIPEEANGSTEVLGLEYLTEYPPESMGDIVIAATEGGGNDE